MVFCAVLFVLAAKDSSPEMAVERCIYYALQFQFLCLLYSICHCVPDTTRDASTTRELGNITIHKAGC
jgi:hypothetical protein